MGQLRANNSTNVPNDMFTIMEKADRFSQIMAKSDIIPTHYRGKPANVFIAIQTAYRMNLDPMLVMQNTYIIGGKLGMYSAFAIALANSSGLFVGGIRYKVEGEGNDLQVTAYLTLKSNNEEISYTIGMKTATAEGWGKTSTKYQSMPELMLRYRAATLLIRTHVPEVINGMQMVEEIEDVAAAKNIIPVVSESKATTLNSKLDDFLSQEEGADIKEVEGQIEIDLASKLSGLLELHNVSQEIVTKWCKAGEVDSLNKLDDLKLQACINYVVENNQTS